MNYRVVLLVMLSSVILIGCFDEKTTKTRQEKDSGIPEQTISEKEEDNIINEDLRINIIDPFTNKVIETINPKEMGFETDLESYKLEIENWAKDLARGTDTIKGYDQRMILDKIDEDGKLIKGSPMIILKEKELVDKIINTSALGGNVELPLYVTESDYDLKDLEHLTDVMVASFTTYFDPSILGRNKNIELSAKALQNVIVGVGDHFSFNTTVGPRTEERGYQPALEIVNGEFVMGIGGGICQTSSTLFNTVDQLKVELVERHHHSKSVGYVPKGRDATVSYGTLDFRFQNTSGIPFVITTKVEKDSITIEIRTTKEFEMLLKKS